MQLTCHVRNGETLASILHSCSIHSLNLSWNDLRVIDPRDSDSSTKELAGEIFGYSLASAALVHPGRLASLELSFNGLADDFGVRSVWCRAIKSCPRIPVQHLKKHSTSLWGSLLRASRVKSSNNGWDEPSPLTQRSQKSKESAAAMRHPSPVLHGTTLLCMGAVQGSSGPSAIHNRISGWVVNFMRTTSL